ncbi:MAG: hypothetical protein ACPGN3_05190 [Opitutales bacterium]
MDEAICLSNQDTTQFCLVVDFAVEFPTFDFCKVAQLAAQAYEESRLKRFVCLLIPSDSENGFRDESFSLEEAEQRLRTITLPLLELYFPRGAYLRFDSRAEAGEFIRSNKLHLFPEDYSFWSKNTLHADKWYWDAIRESRRIFDPTVPGKYRSEVDTWLNQNQIEAARVVLITIRNTQYSRERNCNIPAWRMFAEFLKENAYHPVVIPDGYEPENTYGIDGVVCSEASLDLLFRVALHKAVFLSFTVSNGPSGVFWGMPGVKYAQFNTWVPNATSATLAYHHYSGRFLGDQFPLAQVGQADVWATDEFSNLKFVFERMVGALDVHPDSFKKLTEMELFLELCFASELDLLWREILSRVQKFEGTDFHYGVYYALVMRRPYLIEEMGPVGFQLAMRFKLRDPVLFLDTLKRYIYTEDDAQYPWFHDDLKRLIEWAREGKDFEDIQNEKLFVYGNGVGGKAVAKAIAPEKFAGFVTTTGSEDGSSYSISDIRSDSAYPILIASNYFWEIIFSLVGEGVSLRLIHYVDTTKLIHEGRMCDKRIRRWFSEYSELKDFKK